MISITLILLSKIIFEFDLVTLESNCNLQVRHFKMHCVDALPTSIESPNSSGDTFQWAQYPPYT